MHPPGLAPPGRTSQPLGGLGLILRVEGFRVLGFRYFDCYPVGLIVRVEGFRVLRFRVSGVGFIGVTLAIRAGFGVEGFRFSVLEVCHMRLSCPIR